jgi:hypothetical protein
MAPVRGDGTYCSPRVVVLSKSILGIVMNEDRRIPRAIERSWATMEAFRRFIKKNVTALQNDFVGIFGRRKENGSENQYKGIRNYFFSRNLLP